MLYKRYNSRDIFAIPILFLSVNIYSSDMISQMSHKEQVSLIKDRLSRMILTKLTKVGVMLLLTTKKNSAQHQNDCLRK